MNRSDNRDFDSEAGQLLDFEGAHNFRDLGGYLTNDGRRVKLGHLFRSDKTANFSDADVTRFDALGINTVVDLRASWEIAEQPSRLPDDVEVFHLEIDVMTREAQDQLEKEMISGYFDKNDAGHYVVEYNRRFVVDYVDQVKAFMHLLLEQPRLPLMFHCSMGKDRTGYAAALVLMALGVPEELAIQDYLKTNLHLQRRVQQIMELVKNHPANQGEPEGMRPIFDAEERYLRMALQTIDDEFGGLQSYLHETLDFGDAKIAQLKSNLLDPA